MLNLYISYWRKVNTTKSKTDKQQRGAMMGFSLVFQGKGGNNGAGSGDRTRDPRLGNTI